MERRRRVVVVGAGFAGLELVKGLAAAPVDVVLVDANNFHTFQPLLYQVATAGLDGDDIAAPVRAVVRSQANVDVRLGQVVDIDVDDRRVVFRDGPALSYDRLVLAAGAVTNTYGVPGVDEHGFGLKSLEDALQLRQHLLRQFERASVDPSLVEQGVLDVVIAGGGPTGVELAGGIAELYRNVLSHDFPTLDVRKARVVIVEPGDRVLAPFHPKLSARAARTLARLGVELVFGQGVTGTDGKVVQLDDGSSVPCSTLVWTAGVKASPLADVLARHLGDGTLTRGGRVVVTPELTVPGHPEIAVVGDLAASPDGSGGVLPQLAPVAIQGGRLVAANLVAELAGHPAEPFHYVDKGTMATVGRRNAVAQLPGRLRFSGTPGWLAWLGLHLIMLIGFRNRANVMVNWAWNYVTYDRASRLIVGDDDHPARPSGRPMPTDPDR
ncbi:MAG TPA: NAD(P)/FAD-dependent oxidoreductase [Microthrixaceae bacterium]|nr:NAD(P)/FAD-dependent oxidoreductase [Microthrixaceae bacterium]MCB9402680.1 NAD(P)/FAD-dependent oxidoreductase [Microthrixaceae bacterium]HMV74229.1 NAD(P)/FAD-dependent oxidoreductase [Microthrixaceae bacterium]HMY86865.1 NAD(P)/FAD-dependent oxidoreductase [Microthrixaceae bacterium]HNA36036.1 NAD(P)/FAD-dependent oxidoreductase [Microthrixaceae bacterium]